MGIVTTLDTAMEPSITTVAGTGIIGTKVATRGRVLSTWEPPPIEQQPERLRTNLRGTLTMKCVAFRPGSPG